MGTRSADVLRLNGASVEIVERCSAMDGTWGMKKEHRADRAAPIQILAEAHGLDAEDPT